MRSEGPLLFLVLIGVLVAVGVAVILIETGGPAGQGVVALIFGLALLARNPARRMMGPPDGPPSAEGARRPRADPWGVWLTLVGMAAVLAGIAGLIEAWME
jgi:hypothetical protein